MKGMQREFIKTLDDAFACYGEENLVPISFIKQAIFYVKKGCQPVIVWPKDGNPNIFSYWFLKAETRFLKREWDSTRPGA